MRHTGNPSVTVPVTVSVCEVQESPEIHSGVLSYLAVLLLNESFQLATHSKKTL